jgi:hypothetical protein
MSSKKTGKTAEQKEAEKAAKKAKADAAKAEKGNSAYDFEVGDVKTLEPVALPLIITPKKGEKWKNKAQEEYAKILNGYAYRNPTKFEEKKPVLLANLMELGKNPKLLSKFMGTAAVNGNLKFKDQRFGEVEGQNTGAEETE